MTDVAATDRTGRRGHRLALPVDELGADRIVPVPRRRREVAIALVQSECEQVALRGLIPSNTLAPLRRLGPGSASKRRKEFRPRIARMDAERHVIEPERWCEVSDPVWHERKQLPQLRQHLRVLPKLYKSLLERPLQREIGERGDEHPQESSLLFSQAGQIGRGLERGELRIGVESLVIVDMESRPTARSTASSAGPGVAVGSRTALRSSDQLRPDAYTSSRSSPVSSMKVLRLTSPSAASSCRRLFQSLGIDSRRLRSTISWATGSSSR